MEAKNHSVRKFFAKARSVLKSRRADGYVDTAVKMIIAVVVGALLLSGLYVLFNNTVLPGLAPTCRLYRKDDEASKGSNLCS